MSVSKSQTVAILSLASISIIVCIVFLLMVFIKNRKLKMEDWSKYHFQLDDFFKSAKATEKGIDNSTDDETVILNIQNLNKYVVQPAYEAIPFKINSGYRSPALNTAVGSKAKKSQHLTGEAVDLTTGTTEGNKRLYEYIRKNLPFDQLIAEYGYKVVHVSLKRIGINRKQTLYTEDLIHYKTI